MAWWILELATDVALVAHRALARAVHQAVRPGLRRRRLPRQPADRQELHRADRHRLLPDLHAPTSSSRCSFAPAVDWGTRRQAVTPAQLQFEVVRIGGILLIIGILHGLNIVLMPVLGRLFSLNRRVDRH